MRKFVEIIYSRLRKSISWIEKNWSWGNAITLSALIFSVVQNCVNDKRYNMNEAENNKELARIHDRDSVQSHRDSIRTDLLFNEYHVQVTENTKNSKRDSTQLSLFGSQILSLDKSVQLQNEALKIQFKALTTQNQIFEVQRLSNKSDLSVVTKFNDAEFEGLYASISPATSVTNIGKTDAQNIVYKYCILVLNNWKKNQINCNCAPQVRLNNLSLAPGEYKTFGNLVSFSFKFLLDSSQIIERKVKSEKYLDELMKLSKTYQNDIKNNLPNSIDKSRSLYLSRSSELYKKYPTDPYSYFSVAKISYQDKYQSKREDVYTLVKIVPYVGHSNLGINSLERRGVRFFTSMPTIAEVYYLKNCLVTNGYDYDEIVKMVNVNSSEGNNSINY